MRFRRDTHHVDALRTWAGTYAEAGIEDIESKDAVRRQMTPNGAKERGKLILLTEMEKRIPGDEDQRKLLAKIELPHIPLDEFDSYASYTRATTRGGQHLWRVIQTDSWRAVGSNGHNELSAAARELENRAFVALCERHVEVQLFSGHRQECVVQIRILVEHVTDHTCPVLFDLRARIFYHSA